MEYPAVPEIPGTPYEKSFCLPESAFERHLPVMIVVKLQNEQS
jgi:hypothetical protein